MTALRIDIAKFKAACEEARYKWDGLGEEDRARMSRMGETVYDYFRFEVSSAGIRAASTEPDPRDRSLDAILAEINTAARAAQQYGATEAQCRYLAKLAFDAGDWTGLGSGRLTKSDASRIIDSYKGH